jgi:hypothetical protein
MSYAASLHDARQVDGHAQACAEILGGHIHSARLRDGRSLEELAPQAGLTATEWLALEHGTLLVAWEQILMLAIVLHLGRSWTPYLKKLWGKSSSRRGHEHE